MRGDRRPVSPTELAQLSRCERQVVFDRKYGARRSKAWRARAGEGNAVHADLHRQVTRPDKARGGRMLIALLIATLLLLLALLFLGRSDARDTDALLPPELQGAELWQSEKSLVRQKPVHIRGRPDEVWVKGGRRYIVETKSREGRVFEGDRMQLAAYAYLLRQTDGPPLAPHGYIRFTGGEQTFARVKLRSDEAVIDAHRRFQEVVRNASDLRSAQTAALCRGCGHAQRCPDAKVSV